MHLEQHNYVQCLMIDFSKAFDTIDHCILITKLKWLNLPNYVLRWIVDFLTDRTQCTKVGLNVSLSLDIISSIVQGSGIGPSLFVVYISDLKASDKDNCIIKFADDCSLIVQLNFFRYLLRLRRYKRKSIEVGVFRMYMYLSANFRRKGASPTNHCWCQNSKMIVWHQNVRSALFGFVTKHACDRWTDGQTDRITIAKTALA